MPTPPSPHIAKDESGLGLRALRTVPALLKVRIALLISFAKGHTPSEFRSQVAQAVSSQQISEPLHTEPSLSENIDHVKRRHLA
jgi:hypothetical protein